MAVKDYTPDTLWEAVQRCGSIRAAGRELGLPESSIRRHLKGYTPPLPDGTYVPDKSHLLPSHIDERGVSIRECWADQQQAGDKVRRYIVTSAQNNCRVHEGFWENLQAFAAEIDAEIVIGYTTYDRKGYRGLVTKGDTDLGKHEVWWDETVRPFAVNERVQLHRRLAFCGELDIMATTARPLTGLQAYCGRSSILIPHNKFALQCVASRAHQMPKEMLTTGSVTRSKFIQRKTGQLAHFHHVVGALLVEVTLAHGWYVHHLNAEEDGSFYWLDKYVQRGKVKTHATRLPGLILGDIHVEKSTTDQWRHTLALLRDFDPEQVIIHDLIDFTSRNHHNRDDPFYRLCHYGRPSIMGDLAKASRFLWALKEAQAKGVHANGTVYHVVAANHNAAFLKWIKETDWKTDPVNAELYLGAALQAVKYAEEDVPFNPLEWSLRTLYNHRDYELRFPGSSDSVEIKDIECGIHGHQGPNGAKGSPATYSKLGFKTFTAHTHTPSIIDGCYTVGVMGNLRMGYNSGPSSWMHCHGLIYPNGKRALVWMKDGKYQA